jgi:hypothetical protein
MSHTNPQKDPWVVEEGVEKLGSIEIGKHRAMGGFSTAPFSTGAVV